MARAVKPLPFLHHFLGLYRSTRLTPQDRQCYHDRGILTAKPLSYLFKPRRQHRAAKQAPVRHRLEVMPADTNRGPSVAGGWVRLGGRKLAGGSCRDEILSAIRALTARNQIEVFTACDVYQEMVRAGTRYRASTVFKTMQRMKAPPERPPLVVLERAGREGFRFAEAKALPKPAKCGHA